MRILVTKEGNIIIQDIDDHSQFFGSKSNIYMDNLNNRGHSTGRLQYTRKIPQQISISKYSSKLIRNKLMSPQKGLDKSTFSVRNKIKNFYLSKNLEDEEFTKEEIESAQKIKINNKKTLVPKNFEDKYESDVLNTKPANNSILPSVASKNNLDDVIISKEKYLSFNKIIPKNNITKMKLKILKDRRSKEKETKVTENNFRTQYNNETEIQKFNSALNYGKISVNKSSLIKYLHEKKLDPHLIEILSSSDNSKLSKMNKMCQIFFQNEDKNKIFNDIIKNKVKQQLNGTKKDFHNGMIGLGKDINLIKAKLTKYNRKVDPREKYIDNFYDMILNYWNKRDLERFNKKSTPKPKYLNSIFNGDD